MLLINCKSENGQAGKILATAEIPIAIVAATVIWRARLMV
jgi:hypothetical protein